MKIFMIIPLLWMHLGLSWSQAPGDETCTITPYPDTEKNLMDSRNYIYLLPGNGTGRSIQAGAVWNDYSYDLNDEIQIFTGTFWRHGVAGNCRRTADVCGFDRPGTTQDNWLFTQRINKSFDSNTYNYPVTIHVNITYRMTGCRDDRQPPCTQGFTLFYYLTNSVQLPSLEGNGYMNRNNYYQNVIDYPYAPENGENYVKIYNFTLPSTSTGFYVAARDNGTCTSIRRLRVYRENCKEQRIGLVLYPDAPAPVSGSVNINVQCVENAEFASGRSIASCTSNGEWGTVIPICQCRLGYERTEVNSLSQCRACPAGKYRSATDTACQTCPTKTITTEVAAPKCSCMTGYFRKNITDAGNPFCSGIEPPSTGCTKPPSAPRDESSTVQENNMTVRWSTPADNGGRDDLYYILILRDPAVPNTFINETYLAGDKTTITFYNLQPFTQYCVQVIAHNCVSDQDSGRTQTRTVEVCKKTLEGVPGPVENLQCFSNKIIVWEEPRQPNGEIKEYKVIMTSLPRTDFLVTQTLLKLEEQPETSQLTGTHTFEVQAVNGRKAGTSTCKVRMTFDDENPDCAVFGCNECPEKTENLVLYPATTVPDDLSSVATATTECVENAELSSGNLNVKCYSSGVWDDNGTAVAPVCQCIENFMRSGAECRDTRKCATCPKNVTVSLSVDCKDLVVIWLEVNQAQSYLVRISATGVETKTETVNDLFYKLTITSELKDKVISIEVGTVLNGISEADQEYSTAITINSKELTMRCDSMTGALSPDEELSTTNFIIGLVVTFVVTAVAVFFLTTVLCLLVNSYKSKKYNLRSTKSQYYDTSLDEKRA